MGSIAACRLCFVQIKAPEAVHMRLDMIGHVSPFSHFCNFISVKLVGFQNQSMHFCLVFTFIARFAITYI